MFSRSQGKCVLCAKPAVDAHHILDRKLFEDGGYYLDNGAAVCGDCHLLCEYTIVGVDQVRQAAEITSVILPPGLKPDLVYDKWGNRIWDSGLRSSGPLAQDDGMRKALTKGGSLRLLMCPSYEE